MGAGGDIKEENKKLKERIEKEMKPEIDRLTQKIESKKGNEEKLQKKIKNFKNRLKNLKRKK